MKKLFTSDLLPNLNLLDYEAGSKLTKETFQKTVILVVLTNPLFHSIVYQMEFIELICDGKLL